MAVKTDGKRSNGTVKTAHFATTIDIPREARDKINELLNQSLADTSDLYTQLKHAHWNVKGAEFYQLHLLYDTLAECALEWSDLIAERIAMLGGYAKGTARMAAASSQLPEFPTDTVKDIDTVRALVERYGVYCAAIRKGIDETDELGDPTTADLLTEVSRDADKNRWFLEAHLQA